MSLSSVSQDGRFAVLALDHRDSLRQFLSPDDPDLVSGSELTMIKRSLADGVGPLATGVMLEPEYSIPQVSDTLPPTVGFFAALEAQGYLADPGAGVTRILDGWSVEQAAASGAAAAKLLLPYRPDAPFAAQQRAMAADVVAECRDHGIPLVLEPLFFGLRRAEDRPAVVRQTAAEFSALAPDLLKLPFPVDPELHDRVGSEAACAAVTAECAMPWALLSGGGGYAAFLDQLTTAMDHGCAGFMVGRALWGDAVQAPVADRDELITTQVRGRMAALRAAVGLQPLG